MEYYAGIDVSLESSSVCVMDATGRIVRAFEAGPDGLELIAVGGPKPEGGDGVRSEAPWPEAADA